LENITILLKFFVYVIYCLFLPKKISSLSFSAIFVGYIYHERLNKIKDVDIHFFNYSYVYDVAALIFLLKKNKQKVIHFHEFVNFIDASNSIKTNFLYLNNQIAKEYAKKNITVYEADKYLCNNFFPYPNKGKEIKSIGFYSEGFYARDFSFVKKETILRARKIEDKLHKFLYAYAKENQDLNFIIFPHYHRGVESKAMAIDKYKDILKLKNVELNPDTKHSSETFYEIDLGIVIRSNIFWDRLFEGYKTVMISPFFHTKILEEEFLQRHILNIDDKNFTTSISSLVKDGFFEY